MSKTNNKFLRIDCKEHRFAQYVDGKVRGVWTSEQDLTREDVEYLRMHDEPIESEPEVA